MKSPFNREFWRPENLRNTWEYKTIAFIMRGCVAIVVILYLIFALGALWEWAKTTYVRYQPAVHATVLMDRAKESGDFKRLADWLRRRPQSELGRTAQLVEDNIEDVPFTFISWPLLAAEQAGDANKTAFWQMFSRYRMRYDLVRCGNPVLIEKIGVLISAFADYQPGAQALADISRDPQRLANLLQDVLDYDAQHPARNNPRLTCESFKALSTVRGIPMHREEWPAARQILRIVTEAAIKDMRAGRTHDAQAVSTPEDETAPAAPTEPVE